MGFATTRKDIALMTTTTLPNHVVAMLKQEGYVVIEVDGGLFTKKVSEGETRKDALEKLNKAVAEHFKGFSADQEKKMMEDFKKKGGALPYYHGKRRY